MLSDSLVLWRVILEGCGVEAVRKSREIDRIEDVLYRVIGKGWDRDQALGIVALPWLVLWGTRGEVTGRTH